MNYNELPVHTGCAMTAQDMLENRDTYELLRKVCTRGEAPCGGKTVVKKLTSSYGKLRFAIVCNPSRLDTAHIALFCNRGNLLFGYVANGSIIEIFTD